MSTRVSAAGRSRSMPRISSFIRKSPVFLVLGAAAPVLAQSQVFTPGNLVVLVSGCGQVDGTASSCTIANGTGVNTLNNTAGGYGDNQASPVTLFQYAPNGVSNVSFVNATVMPQTTTGVNNLPLSAEYGSSSEGMLQLSGDSKYLTFMEYSIPATTYNASPLSYGPVAALAQSTSVTGQSTYTPVGRVVALVDAFGTVKSNTAVYNVFDENNPRSVFSPDGTRAWISGQGNSPDHTGGVFYTALGATNNSPSPVTGNDTTSNTYTQDTRDVQIVNGQLYVSVDSKAGSGAARSYLGTLGTPGNLPTTAGSTGTNPPVMLNGFGNTGGTGKVTIGTGSGNNGNAFNAGQTVNVSPVGYFFANAYTLYVADSGNGKQTSAESGSTGYVGDGGLQKWVNSAADGSGTWSLAYTLYHGLNLVQNPSAVPANASGTTGLYALTGKVVGSSVLLYATNYTISDLDQTYLFGISDTLSYTTPSQAASETFTTLATAPKDSNFKGVSFAPAAAPGVVGFNVESTEVSPTSQLVSVSTTGTFSGAGTNSPTAPITMQVGSSPVIPAGCGAYFYTGVCTVNFPVSYLASGANTVTVQYAGDSNYQPITATGTVIRTGTLNYVGVTVNGVSTTTGTASVQLSAVASWPSGQPPTNTTGAYFKVDNGTQVPATCALNPSNLYSATCTATYTTSATPTGYHSINFVYPGDAYFQPSFGSSTLFLK